MSDEKDKTILNDTGARSAHDSERLEADLRAMMHLVNGQSQPNFSALALKLKDLELLTLNVKYFGYELARRIAAELPPQPTVTYRPVGLICKPATQIDLQSDWAAYWCNELKIGVTMHRKVWEFVFFLQALAERDMLKPGRAGLGFGCGEEPVASYLAARGVKTLVTDLLGEDAAAQGWRSTGQHLASLDMAYKEHLVERAQFDEMVSHRYVDMNAIPADLRGFDFCWSICALEHLGTLDKAMQFVINAMETLRPGGVAIHTTEFNFLNQEQTLDNWPTVLPQRRHFEALAENIRSLGHQIEPLDFNVGDRPLDRFIDIPPYPGDPSRRLELMAGEHDCQHLKLSIDGFASTCFGLIIRKGGKLS